MSSHTCVGRIVSGAQTGVDLAALDVALALGIPCGGWVPLGRQNERGRIPDDYPNLKETDSPDVDVRTERNVDDSDATLIISRGELSGGSLNTLKTAARYQKPCLHVDLDKLSLAKAVRRVEEWLARCKPAVLNVAGPRESENAGINRRANELLEAIFDGNVVSGDAKYSAMFSEVVARVGLRDTALWNLLSGSTALLAIIMSFESAKDSSIRQVAVLIPLLTFFLSLMITHHEVLITKLVNALREMTHLDPDAWHSKLNTFGQAGVKDRLWFNGAHGLSILILNIGACLFAATAKGLSNSVFWLTNGVTILFTALTMLLIYYAARQRMKS